MALTFIGGKTWVNGDIANSTNLNSIVDSLSYSGQLEVAKGGTGAATAAAARVALNRGELALTDQATITTDCSSGNVFTVTLGGNRTLAAPTNQVAGSTYIWRFTQDGSGGRTISFNSAFKFPGGTDPTLSTGAGAVDIVSGLSDGTNIYCSVLLNLA